jgi:S-DNA-T family DNA segregation ATPase FtsK/SpoIIIE
MSTDVDNVIRLHPDDDDPPVLVDQHLAPDIQEPARRPIIPAGLRRENFRDTVNGRSELYWYRFRYHGMRVPKYGIAGTFWATVGLFKLTAAQLRWWWLTEATPLRLSAVDDNDPVEYGHQLKQARSVRAFRGYCLLAEILAVAGYAVWLGLFAPGWAAGLTLVAAVPLLAHLGRPADRPIITRAVTPLELQPLKSEHVILALSRLGIKGINDALKNDPQHALGWPSPVREDGPGWRAEVDLPPGVIAAEVIDKRDKLASALNRPLGCVWPEGDPEVSPGRLVLWVGKKDIAKARQPAWPLLKSGAVDLFRTFPFGTDQRGRMVSATLIYVSWLIGAVPRMGKTFALRLVLLAAALDPRAELHVYDLKGTGDLSPLEPVAHRYRAGDVDDDIAYALADLKELQAELRRRTKKIRDLPRDLCPENKVTSELASNRTHRLHPIVIAVDECQMWFEHANRGKEFEDICTDLVKRGPAVGIALLLATQRPNATSVPKPISSNAILRFCLKVIDHDGNNMVLGSGSYNAGYRATMFSRRDVGIGYLAGEDADPRIVRTYFVDAAMADRVITRARKLREAAGTLTGYALGQDSQDVERHSYNLLGDINACIGSHEDKLWSETILTRLADLRPDVYTGWTTEQFALALRPYGVSTDQIGRRVDGQIINRRGIDASDIRDALRRKVTEIR